MSVIPRSQLESDSFVKEGRDGLGLYTEGKLVGKDGSVWVEKSYHAVEVDGIHTERTGPHGGYFFSWKEEEHLGYGTAWEFYSERQSCDICWVYMENTRHIEAEHSIALRRRAEILGEVEASCP